MQQAPADARRRAPLAVGDVVLGALSVVGGVAVVLYSRGMPTMGEALHGPGLFPMIIGWFLVVLGAALVVRAVVAGRRGVAVPTRNGSASPGGVEPAPGDRNVAMEPEVDGPGAEPVAAPALAAQDGHWVNAAVVLGGIIFYVLAAGFLGFPLTMFLVLTAIMLVLRSRVVAALLTAAGITAGLYAVFELLLLVQLPNGFLG
ncbi:tripartite tricarboxylate transporter TctB family protein [Kocuria aegyptia]|uniref:DUF1468 domain-containing protein n=1 Tax=Kocuria aegyptia TaxID=330943 RepID=A0ABN2KVX2_9MICC